MWMSSYNLRIFGSPYFSPRYWHKSFVSIPYCFLLWGFVCFTWDKKGEPQWRQRRLLLSSPLAFISLYTLPQGYKIAAPLPVSQPYSGQEELEWLKVKGDMLAGLVLFRGFFSFLNNQIVIPNYIYLDKICYMTTSSYQGELGNNKFLVGSICTLNKIGLC